MTSPPTGPDAPRPEADTDAVPGVPGDPTAESPPGEPRAPQGAASKRGEPSTTEVVPGSNSRTEVERGLVALIAEDGSARRAERLLGEQGKRISEKTLRNWRDNLYTARYLELRRTLQPRINAFKAEMHDQVATAASSLSLEMLERLQAEYSKLPLRDLPGAVRNVSTVAGIHSDKSVLIGAQDSGSQPMYSRSAAEIIGSLQAKAPHLFENGRLKVELQFGNKPDPASIEGTATEER